MANEMKVLITGAAGFTGPYMASALRARGYSVIAGARDGEPSSHEFDEWVKFDITEIAEVKDTLAEIDPDYVIHLAGVSFVGHSNLSAFYQVNVLGTENLLSALDSQGSKKLKSVLLASSANVYGTPENVRYISEDLPASPVNHYAISKLAMEFVAKTFQSKLPVIVARPFNYIGCGQDKSFVIPKIVSAFANDQPSIELGSIDVSRDFTFVKDTASAYVELISHSQCIGETYNVCSSKSWSLSEVLEFMSVKAGYEIDVITNPAFVRKNEIKNLCGDNSKIRKHTGWAPRVEIQEALYEIYDYCKNLNEDDKDENN